MMMECIQSPLIASPKEPLMKVALKERSTPRASSVETHWGQRHAATHAWRPLKSSPPPSPLWRHPQPDQAPGPLCLGPFL